MSDNTRRDVTSEDFDDLPEVPTYTGETGSTKVPTPPQDIYQRTGKAAPTEVFPASPTPAPAPAAAPAAVPFAGEPTEYLAPGEAGPLGEEVVAEPLARRGTTDFGLLLLRVLVGGYLILDALKVFFGLGGSAGIAGLEGEFAAYPYGEALAVVVPTLELAAGVFLVLGLLAPVAALVALAVTGFLLAHVVAASPAGANPFTWDAAVWLAVFVFAASLVLQFTGPGLYGVDAGRSWARRPLASSWICAALGVAAAGVMWWFGTGINPLA